MSLWYSESWACQRIQYHTPLSSVLEICIWECQLSKPLRAKGSCLGRCRQFSWQCLLLILPCIKISILILRSVKARPSDQTSGCSSVHHVAHMWPQRHGALWSTSTHSSCLMFTQTLKGFLERFPLTEMASSLVLEFLSTTSYNHIFQQVLRSYC